MSYADWTVHTEIDRSPVCFEILRDITQLIGENWSPTNPNLPSLISQVIGFPTLRAQMIDLFRKNGLPTVVFDFYENWRDFVGFLLWHVAGQPIILGDNDYLWHLQLSGDKDFRLVGTAYLGEGPENFDEISKRL